MRPSLFFGPCVAFGLLLAGCAGPRSGTEPGGDGVDPSGDAATGDDSNCDDGQVLQMSKRRPSGSRSPGQGSGTPAGSQSGSAAASGDTSDCPVEWIDTHAHPFAGPGQTSNCLDTACLNRTAAKLASFGVRTSFMMPMPTSAGRSGESEIASLGALAGDRYMFLNGGFSLMPLIHEAIDAGNVSSDLQNRFDEAADAVAAQGALGYGELAALHVSFNPQHPYEFVPPDHPLFLRLADHAARHGLVLDLHMEFVVTDKPTPDALLQKSSSNPVTLPATQPGFERLLAHNRDARIVWAHVGWDNTNDMTPQAIRALLEAHPNLFLQFKGPFPAPVFPDHNVLDAAGHFRPDWLQLVRDYPARFVVGTDVLYAMSDAQVDMALGQGLDIVEALPADLQARVGVENAEQIYRVPAAG